MSNEKMLSAVETPEQGAAGARCSLAAGSALIVCAAMKMRDGHIVAGVRHFSPDMRATLRRIYGERYKFDVAEQGFIDTRGNFLTRAEAWQVATEHKQIRRAVSTPGTLYSENLY